MFHDAHRGSFRLQSAQTLFSGLLSSSLSVFACFSVVALSCRDMLVRVSRKETRWSSAGARWTRCTMIDE